jgi:hypothetical protein
MDLQLFEREIWAYPSDNDSWRSSQAVGRSIQALDIDGLRATTGAGESPPRPGCRSKFSAAEFRADGAEYRRVATPPGMRRVCGEQAAELR